MLYRPTAEEKRIIRACAEKSAGYRRVEINPSTKVSLTNPHRPIHMNVALVSDDPDFADTDLFDNAFTWKDFTRGVEMTADQRAIVDFYVYDCTHDKELQTNVTIYVEGGRLDRVEGTGDGVMWTRN